MDRPEDTQDVTTSEDTKETSEKDTQTFTREQVEEREQKAKSDALADINRYKTEAQRHMQAAQAAEERTNRMLKEQGEAELETARDEPDKLTLIRERQARRQAESELATAKQELDGEKAKTAEAQEAEAKSTKERNAREIATRLVVDAKTLREFTDGSTEAMEKLAKVLPKKDETKEPLKPDSGKTSGGGEKTDDQKLKERYPTM